MFVLDIYNIRAQQARCARHHFVFSFSDDRMARYVSYDSNLMRAHLAWQNPI